MDDKHCARDVIDFRTIFESVESS